MPIFHGLACRHVDSVARHELQKKRHMMCIIWLCSCCASPHHCHCLPPWHRCPLPLPPPLCSSSPNCLSLGPLSGALSSTHSLPYTVVWLQNQNCFHAALVACVHALRIRTTSSSPSSCGSAGRSTLTAMSLRCPPQRPHHCLYHCCCLHPLTIAPSLSVIVILLVVVTKTSTTIPPGCCQKTRMKTRLLFHRCRPIPAVIAQSARCSVAVPSVVHRPPPPPHSLPSIPPPPTLPTLHPLLPYCGGPPSTKYLTSAALVSRAVPPPLAL
jgi:hypothetical protein